MSAVTEQSAPPAPAPASQLPDVPKPSDPASESVVTPPAQPAPVEPAPESRLPTVKERLASLFQPKSAMLATANDARSELAKAISERDAFKSRAEAAESRVSEFETAIQSLEAERKNVGEAVLDEMAKLGVDSESLPSSAVGGTDSGETEAELEKQFASCADPVEAGKLAEKIRSLSDQN